MYIYSEQLKILHLFLAVGVSDFLRHRLYNTGYTGGLSSRVNSTNFLIILSMQSKLFWVIFDSQWNVAFSCSFLVVAVERELVELELAQSWSALLGLADEVSEFLDGVNLLFQVVRLQKVTELKQSSMYNTKLA